MCDSLRTLEDLLSDNSLGKPISIDVTYSLLSYAYLHSALWGILLITNAKQFNNHLLKSWYNMNPSGTEIIAALSLEFKRGIFLLTGLQKNITYFAFTTTT